MCLYEKIVDLLNDKISSINVYDLIRNGEFINEKSKKQRKIYIIDIFRTPIERKISEFFEYICQFHFNNTEEFIINYPVQKLIKRFNDIYPYFSDEDYFNERYNIEYKLEQFDFEKKFIIYEKNNVTYIKLRLIDSKEWSNILSNIFRGE